MKNLFFKYWSLVLETPNGSTIFKEPYRKDKCLMAAALSAVQFSAEAAGSPIRTLADLIRYAKQNNDPVGLYLEDDKKVSHINVGDYLRPELVPEESFADALLDRIELTGCKKASLFPEARKVILSLISDSPRPRGINSAIFYGVITAELAFDAARNKIHSKFVAQYKEWGELFTAIFSRFAEGFLTFSSELQGCSERVDIFFAIGQAPAIEIPPELKRLIFKNVEGPIFFLSPKSGMGLFRTEKERRDFIEEFGLSSVVDFGGSVLDGTLIPFYLLECPGDRQKNEVKFLYFPRFPLSTRRKKSSDLNAWAHHCLSFLRGDPMGTGVEEIWVPLSKIEENQWKIFPPLYYTSIEKKRLDQFISELKAIDLSKEFEIIRCQPLSRFTNEASSPDIEKRSTKVYEIRLSHVESTGEIEIPEIGALKLPSNQLSESRLSRQVLHPGDVLLGVLGSVGKIAVVTDVPGNACWVASQAFAVLRPKGHRSGESAYLLGLYLFLYLRSEIVWNYLLSSADEGGGAKSLSFDVLKKLPFVIPSEKDLLRAEEDYRRVIELNDQIKRMQNEIERILTVNLTNRIAEEKHQGRKGKK